MPRNRWHQHLMEHYYGAAHTWERDAEAASNGWLTELREFAEVNPRPQLKHFMIHLSYGQAE